MSLFNVVGDSKEGFFGIFWYYNWIFCCKICFHPHLPHELTWPQISPIRGTMVRVCRWGQAFANLTLQHETPADCNAKIPIYRQFKKMVNTAMLPSNAKHDAIKSFNKWCNFLQQRQILRVMLHMATYAKSRVSVAKEQWKQTRDSKAILIFCVAAAVCLLWDLLKYVLGSEEICPVEESWD